MVLKYNLVMLLKQGWRIAKSYPSVLKAIKAKQDPNPPLSHIGKKGPALCSALISEHSHH